MTVPNKICLAGDIHSNFAALEAVVRDAGQVDAWWCVGDVVGYGPDPNECVETVSELGAIVVAGNHDAGTTGKMSLSSFNMDARVAGEWTAGVLTANSKSFLESLPETHYLEDSDSLLVHGSPTDPMWEYVVSATQAERNFEAFTANICFIGHTHVPLVFATPPAGSKEGVSETVPADGETIRLEAGRRYLVNVGSVGQPRDGDPRACYVMFEPAAMLITYYRVDYEVALTRRRMEEASLPSFLSSRLELGR